MSAKGLASILAALGAGMSGYAKGREINQRNERQKVLDEREDEQYARGQAKQARADKLENDLAASQQDQVVENIPSYDISQMNGGDPEKQPTVGYKAAGQTFADQSAAQAALYGANSRASKDQRAAAVLRASGDPAMIDRARQMEEFAANAIKEGTDQILSGIQSGASQLDAVKKAGGKVARQVGPELAEVFNKTGGKWKVSADTMVEDFIDKDATGREFVNQRVLGKDGKPVVDDVHNASRMLLSVKERMAAANDDQRTYLTAQQQAESVRHNGAMEKNATERLRADTAHQAATLGLQSRRLSMEEKSFKKQGLSGQIADIEEVTGVKLTADEKKVLAGIKPGKGVKDADALGAKIVEQAVKTYQENTPNVTTGQIATFRANLERDMSAARGNLQVTEQVRERLAQAKPGADYAATWADAQSELGMTEKQLTAMGFKPPATVPNPMAGPAKVAASAGAGPRPAPRTPHPQSTPVNAGNYNRNVNAFDQQPTQNNTAQQRAQLQGEVGRLEQLVASGEGPPQFRAQQAARLDLYKRQLAALPQ